MCDSLGFTVERIDIEVCHRMFQKEGNKRPKKTTVLFTNRRFAEQLMEKRKGTKDAVETFGSPADTEIYFNDNLCTYYRKLWGQCRKLKKDGLIESVWTKNGMVRVKRDQSSPTIKITHWRDLGKNFPEF